VLEPEINASSFFLSDEENMSSGCLDNQRAYMKNNTYENLFMTILEVKANERKNVLLPM
jgi:hypothetical protein